VDEADNLSETTAATDGQDAGVPAEPHAVPTASANGHPDASTRQPASAEPCGMLAAGDHAGAFRIERVLRASPEEALYLGAESGAADEREPGAAPAVPVLLQERPAGGFSELAPVIALALRHPRILNPRRLFTHDGHDLLVSDVLVTADRSLPPSVAQGGRLDPTATLIAGTGLADALGYLHRNGVVHLHVSPDAILVHEGRAYLAGMEGARRIAGELAELATLFARDANFLARTLGILAGLSPDAADDRELAQQVLREIAQHGEANLFTSVDEVAAACASALQTGPAPELQAEASHVRLAYAIGSATTVGCVRSENQDACACASFDVHDDVAGDMPLHILLVADGMGGEARGEIASRIAARTVTAELARGYAFPTLIRQVDVATDEDSVGHLGGGALRRAMAQAVAEANRRIRVLAGILGQTTGTTLSVVAVHGSQAVLAHLGDSRIYLLRGDSLMQLTEDHSVLARLQAIDHPLLSDPEVYVPRNMLYRSLGQEDETSPDLLEFSLSEGDRLLICSDGLWDELDDQTLADTLAAATDPRVCAETLVAMANAAGGHDNSTAVVVFVAAHADVMPPASASDEADGVSPDEPAPEEQ
jgi:serine/threonine protein phosphatase PrpC